MQINLQFDVEDRKNHLFLSGFLLKVKGKTLKMK